MTTSTTNLYRETVFEQYLMAGVFRLSVWLPPLIPAYMAANASIEHLGFSTWMAVVTGVMIEALGMAACHNMLTFTRKAQALSGQSETEVAQSRLKTSRWLAGFYLGTVISIVLVLKIFSGAAMWALLLLTLASPVGAMVYLMRNQYVKEEDEERFQEELEAEELALAREFEIEERKLESELRINERRLQFEIKRAKLQRQIDALHNQSNPSKSVNTVDTELNGEDKRPNTEEIVDRLQQGKRMKAAQRREQLLSIVSEAPDIAIAELSRQLSAAENTVRSDLKVLEADGVLTRNGVIEVHVG